MKRVLLALVGLGMLYVSGVLVAFGVLQLVLALLYGIMYGGSEP